MTDDELLELVIATRNAAESLRRAAAAIHRELARRGVSRVPPVPDEVIEMAECAVARAARGD